MASLVAAVLLSLFCKCVNTNNVSVFCPGIAGLAVLYLLCGEDEGIHLSLLSGVDVDGLLVRLTRSMFTLIELSY